MKYLWIPVFFLFVIGCSSGKEKVAGGFDIHGTIAGVEDGTTIYMEKVQDNQLVKIDSAQLKDGKFEFTGKVDYPEMIYLRIGDSRNMINLYVENNEIDIESDVSNLAETKVKGSKTHDDLVAFQEAMKPFEKQSQEIVVKYQQASANGDQQKVNELMKEYEALSDKQNEAIEAFIKKRNDSYLTPFIIRRYLVFDLNGKELSAMLEPISETVRGSEDYKELAKRAETLKRVDIGQPAVDFTLNDPDGNPIALSSFRGKYVLIDFWASWCKPCRMENPNVVKVYNDYKDKGFEILGVSFDEDKNKWVDAIKADHLTWSQVSDLKGWKSMAAGLYAVNSIPHTVLIDPQGIIIAKNLRGDSLREKLVELIDKKSKG